jgi:hypothetical protein
MWANFGDMHQEFAKIRRMVALQHQTPTQEWPLVFVDEHDLLLVVRSWPDGTMTAYATAEYSDTLRGQNPPLDD